MLKLSWFIASVVISSSLLIVFHFVFCATKLPLSTLFIGAWLCVVWELLPLCLKIFVYCGFEFDKWPQPQSNICEFRSNILHIGNIIYGCWRWALTSIPYDVNCLLQNEYVKQAEAVAKFGKELAALKMGRFRHLLTSESQPIREYTFCGLPSLFCECAYTIYNSLQIYQTGFCRWHRLVRSFEAHTSAY